MVSLAQRAFRHATRLQSSGGGLLRLIDGRHREMASTCADATGHLHQAFVNDGEAARMRLLERASYQPVRYFFTMVRPTLDAIANFPCHPPSGRAGASLHRRHAQHSA